MFYKTQFPHKSVNVSFIITNIKKKKNCVEGDFSKRLYQNFMRDTICITAQGCRLKNGQPRPNLVKC